MGKLRHRDVHYLPKLTQLPNGKARTKPRHHTLGQHTILPLNTAENQCSISPCLCASNVILKNFAKRGFVLDPSE